MFRNMRIAVKLSLGFGLLLLLFTSAVFFSWMKIDGVQEESRFLSEVSDAMLLSGRIERTVAALRLSVRGYRYVEQDSYLQQVRANEADLKADLAEAKALYEKNPALTSLKNAVEVEKLFAQVAKEVDTAAAKTDEKRALIAKLAEQGQILQKLFADNIELQYKSVDGELNNPQEIRRRIDRIRVSDHLLFQMTEIRRRYFAGMFQRNAQALQELRPQMDAMQKDVELLHADVRRQEVKLLLEQAVKGTTEYFDTLSKIITLFTDLFNLYVNLDPVNEQLSAASAAISTASQELTKKVALDSESSLRFAVTILMALTALSVVVGVLIAFFIARVITAPLNRIVLLADRAKKGDLTIVRRDFGYEGRDELGKLSEALAEMVVAQRESVREIITLAHEATGGADALLGAANRGSASARDVKLSVDDVVALCESNSSALEESNAGTEEMSAGAMTSAQSSTECAEFIAQTTEVSEKAVGMVQDTIHDMETLHDKARESGKKLEELVGSVERIGEFVDVITSIANQTNLLALNAAIEAARAGDAGRGFAVVAEEVRKLAEESGGAAQNVQKLIETLQANARGAMDASVESSGILETTLEKAEGAKAELEKAMTQIDNANDRIQNIAAVAQEQAASSREIATSIDVATRSTVDMLQKMETIRTATDGTAEVSEDVAGQAGKVNDLAARLTQVLSGFKVEETRLALAK